jgi:tRNA(Arg) A34 adenosine deaminase TadA
MTDEDALRRAIALAVENVAAGGGPFGAVVVRDGRIIGEGANRVTRDNDPTAHAEVVAIRDACRRLGTFKLDGAVVYSSCEPCPMCWSTIQWSRASRLCFAADKDDAAVAGFDDAVFWREVAVPMAELTAELMAKQIISAEADLADAKPGEAQRKATEVLNQLKALQASL